MASLKSSSFSKWKKIFQGQLYPKLEFKKFATYAHGKPLSKEVCPLIFFNNVLQLIPLYCNNDPCMNCGLLLISLDDHYQVTKNLHIHGNVVFSYGTLRAHQRATKLAFLYCKIIHFLQVCSQKPLCIIFLHAIFYLTTPLTVIFHAFNT